MDARLLRSLRWALAVSGVLGLLCAASMLLTTQASFGHSSAAVSLALRLPSWAVWSAAPPGEVPMLIAGALCALLLVAGGWPIKACAGLVAAWFIYAQSAFGSGSRWAQQLAQSFEVTPFRTGALVGVVALLAVSVLALVLAARSTVAARALLAGTTPAELGDAAQPPLS